MKEHQTAHNATRTVRRIRMPQCPSCNDLLLAAAASSYVSEREVRHFWSCDACGHEFTTSVGLRSRRSEEVRPSVC